MITHHVLGLKKRIDVAERSETAFSRDLISDPVVDSGAYSRLLGVSKREGLARWDAGERSMALRFPMHFLSSPARAVVIGTRLWAMR